MRKLSMLILVMLVVAGMALAQNTGQGLCTATITTGCIAAPGPGTLPAGLSSNGFNKALGQDVLGAHNGYGRGCVMCHAPHGGALGNNAPNGTSAPNATYGYLKASNDTLNGSIALWGENLAPYYGATVTFAGGNTVVLPTSSADTSEGSGATTILLCLSCHDGAITKVAMMTGTTVEALPVVGGSAPTLFGTTPGNTALNYINEHPVGPGATVSAGTSHNWDGSGGGSGGTYITMGANFKQYASTDYPASLWYSYATGSTSGAPPSSGAPKGYPLATFGLSAGGAGNAYTVNGVTCTTCHNQHSMTVYLGGPGGTTAYPTMFFIKGEYMPSTGGNSVAQFCRNCHGGESNEMSGVNVPTT